MNPFKVIEIAAIAIVTMVLMTSQSITVAMLWLLIVLVFELVKIGMRLEDAVTNLKIEIDFKYNGLKRDNFNKKVMKSENSLFFLLTNHNLIVILDNR